MLGFFGKYNAEMVGISVDSKWCHQAFSQSRNLHFPLLADFEPKGEVSRKFGVYNAEKGQSSRVLFVVDRDGIIRWSYLSPDGENPGAAGILQALETIIQKENA
jgi:peroxiredoxin